MSKARLISMSALACLAVSAMAPGSASAAAHEFLVKGSSVPAAGIWYAGWNLPYAPDYLEFDTKGSTRIELFCYGLSYRRGLLKPSGTLTEFASFTDPCYIYETKNRNATPLPCTLAYFLQFVNGRLTSRVGAEIELGGAGTQFASFKIEGTGCTIANTYSLKGGENCYFPWFQYEITYQNWICGPTGSSLEIEGTESQLIVNDLVRVTGFQSWGST